MQQTQINKGDKFVACWGYDQTQYSIYNVVDVKGQFVTVEGMNGWSSLDTNDLCAGSKVKILVYKNWRQLSPEEQQDLESRGFRHYNYDQFARKDASEAAEVRTITKVNRIDGQRWTYIWELDNGEVIRSDENYENDRAIEIVQAYKRCRINTKWSEPSIKIDDVITAYLDKDFNRNNARYEAQNEYTAYNGR